jgi:CRP/FNR family transcriptional regulator, cyclic AMP receptor protein
MPGYDGIGAPAWSPRSFMARLPSADRTALLALGVTRPIRPHTRLFVEGAEGTHVEVLRRGYVKITSEAAGASRLLAIRLPGDLLGELAPITGGVRSATVTACGHVVSTVIRSADFLRYVAQHPRVGQEVTATVGERLRWANARRSEFTAYPVTVRLARVLRDIAEGCGTPGGRGGPLGVQLNQAELAALIGAAEDTVQRALRSLRDDGLVGTGYRTITVLDPDGLRALAAGVT